MRSLFLWLVISGSRVWLHFCFASSVEWEHWALPLVVRMVVCGPVNYEASWTSSLFTAVKRLCEFCGSYFVCYLN